MLQGIDLVLVVLDTTCVEVLVLTALVGDLRIDLAKGIRLSRRLFQRVVNPWHRLLIEPFDVGFIPLDLLGLGVGVANVDQLSPLKEHEDVDGCNFMVLTLNEQTS